MRTRRTLARLPSEPPYKSKIPKGGFGALWRVFLRYLSSRKERYGAAKQMPLGCHRRSFRKENASKNEKQNDSAPGGRRKSREVRKTVQSKTKNGQTPPVCPFAFILRQHRTIASATFSGAFTLEIRYFFLKYTKYSCEKLPFSTAKSPAECSCRIMRYCLRI